MEDNIDLRPYIAILIRQWRYIAVIVIAASIGAALIALFLPSTYTARSDVLLLPSRSQLTFDPRFVTNNAILATDITSRRQALVALASSPSIEAQVLPKLPADLVGQDYRPGSLVQRLRITAEGDLLRIEASAPDAQAAQTLAETWAQAYVHSVNDLYGRDSAMLHEIEIQVAEAQKRYDEAQHNLETFIGSSPIVQVQQQISMTTELLDQSIDGTRKLYAQYLDQARALEGTLHDAETLRQQVAVGQTEGLGNALAAVALRARAAGNVQLPIELRFDDPSVVTQNGATLADLDRLISVLQQRRDELMKESQSLAQAISDSKGEIGGLPPDLRNNYAQRLSQLQQQYEQQTAQMHLLEQRRDLAIDSLTILQRKLEEQYVAIGTPEVQLHFISAAVQPPRGRLSRIALFGSMAAVVSFLLSVMLVLGLFMLRRWLPSQQHQIHAEHPLDRPTTG